MSRGSEEREFRVSPLDALLRVLLPPAIFAVAWWVIRAFEPDQSHTVFAAVGLTFFVSAVLDLRRWRIVVVSSQGIRNSVGKLVPWSRISAAARYHGLGGGIIVNSFVDAQVTIRGSIARQPEFQAAVRAYLPAGAPLLEALDRYRQPAGAT